MDEYIELEKNLENNINDEFNEKNEKAQNITPLIK